MYLKVAIDLPLHVLFDYLEGGFSVSVGQRVLVPFGKKRNVSGIVVARVKETDQLLEKLKPIIRVLDTEVVIDAPLFSLLKWSSAYYQYPFGQAVMGSLPIQFRQNKPVFGALEIVKTYALTARGLAENIDILPKRQAVQRRIFALLKQRGHCQEDALFQLSSGWKKAVSLLENAGLVRIESSEIYRNVDVNLPSEFFVEGNEIASIPQLNAEQENAVRSVCKRVDQFSVFLLYGVTGSGKTEVYMQILQNLLAGNDKQALLLVPEINLTPQLEMNVRNRLTGFSIVALHSDLSDTQRLKNWRLARSGLARIVIGTRLSVFAVLPKLSVIVVDEEHDGSYKQKDTMMRYHARDVAIMRAKQLNIPIVLGSATPSLESWHNAEVGKYVRLNLLERAVKKAILPKIVFAGTDAQLHGLSVRLQTAIGMRLEQGEQSLIFINRRGYSPVLMCYSCRWVASCSRCSSRLVLHLSKRQLRCHYCDHQEKITAMCPSCGNLDLQPVGQGTQKVEETLAVLFPQARICRIDRDTVKRRQDLERIFTDIRGDKIDILVGTQMLAKGHDFHRLTLVGVLDADSALYSPDFRLEENFFAQLLQVAGRAGRGELAGEVIVQTNFPQHRLFQALKKHDYIGYAEVLLGERQRMGFPPYTIFAILRAEAKNYAQVANFLQKAQKIALEISIGQAGIHVYSPIRAVMEKVKGAERGQLLIKAKNRNLLQKVLTQLTHQLRQEEQQARIKWFVDVDPMEF